MSTNTTTKQAEAYLEALAEDLSVSEKRYEDAERSYHSFGDWLHRDESSLRRFSPQVYVQGSFRLGTTIRPPSGEEDYDVDAVCELQALSTTQLSQKKLKEMLGAEVTAYHRAQAMTKPVREGRRCWVLNYADGAQFHMDIVPCVPDAATQRRVMETANVSTEWSETAVAITDNERWNYGIVEADWCRSNPKAYSKWFISRMIVQLQKRKRILAEAAYASVENIPDYRVRTPLQSAIMILKRHRDLRFQGDAEDRPISIILTTLAAHAYNGEETIAEALNSILQRMDQYVLHDGQNYIIANPTNPLENFADKWETHPHRADAFFAWLEQARAEFAYVSGLTDARAMTESVAPMMGRELAEAAFKRTGGGSGNTLLKAASVAPMTGGLSFPDAPRVPTTKKGFA